MTQAHPKSTSNLWAHFRFSCACAELCLPAPPATTAYPSRRGSGPDSLRSPGGLNYDAHGAARDVRGSGNVPTGTSHLTHVTGTADHNGSEDSGHAPVAKSFCGCRIGGLRWRPTVRKKVG